MNKLLPVSCRKKFSGVFNTALHVSRETFWDKTFFFCEKKLFWLCLLILIVESVDFGKIFNKCVKTEFNVTSTTFWKKFLGKESQFYIFLCFFLRKSWFWNVQVCQEGSLGAQRNTLGDNSLEEIKIICIFWALNENLSGFWQNEFDRVAKTAVHVIREALGIKWFFFKKKIKFESFSRDLAKEFWTLGKCIHKVSQIRNLRVHKNCKRKCGRTRKAFYVSSGTFRGKNFWRKQKFMTFGQWTICCRFHAEESLAEFSTPHFMCPEKQFETKSFFSEKNINLTLFADFQWRISGFSAKFFNKRVHTEIFETRGTFWVFFEEDTTLYLFTVFF